MLTQFSVMSSPDEFVAMPKMTLVAVDCLSPSLDTRIRSCVFQR